VCVRRNELVGKLLSHVPHHCFLSDQHAGLVGIQKGIHGVRRACDLQHACEVAACRADVDVVTVRCIHGMSPRPTGSGSTTTQTMRRFEVQEEGRRQGGNRDAFGGAADQPVVDVHILTAGGFAHG
jgi:hypothetical protein